jgi:hypothetical protein
VVIVVFAFSTSARGRKAGTGAATHAHPSSDDHDDTVEAHYSGLERLRPHACIDGWVFVGYVDEDGEEREASYPCRRCAYSR